MIKLKYLNPLDGIRATAALMVMSFHFLIGVDDRNLFVHIMKKVSIFGQTGVTLFFVLSGFLITRILLVARNDSDYFSNFYIKRALRILPLYYFFLFLYYFILLPLVHQPAIELHETWYYWVFLQNFADTFNWPANGPQHYWSLAVEEHFYLFWPFIVYFCSKKNLLRAIYIIIALALISRILIISLGYGTFYLTFTTMDCLAMGALLAVKEASITKNIRLWKRAALLSGLLLILFWLAVGGRGNDTLQVLKLPVIACFYTALMAVAIGAEGILKWFFSLPVLRFTGKISYGLYIYHPACFMIIHYYFQLPNLLINATVCFGTSFFFAITSYYLFEARFLNLKHTFVKTALQK